MHDPCLMLHFAEDGLKDIDSTVPIQSIYIITALKHFTYKSFLLKILMLILKAMLRYCTIEFLHKHIYVVFNPLPHGGILYPIPRRRVTIDRAQRRL